MNKILGGLALVCVLVASLFSATPVQAITQPILTVSGYLSLDVQEGGLPKDLPDEEEVDVEKLDATVWNEWSKGKKAELKPLGLGWSQDTMPWKAEFKRNVTDSQPFVYREGGKFISFEPIGLWWTTPQGSSVIKQGVSFSPGIFDGDKVKYANVLGEGIGLEVSVDRTTWRKEVTIESLVSLGAIPASAEYLEIGFEIETDFDIEGWDKRSDYQFNRAIQLSELSKLESIKAWDNHVIPEPKEWEEPEDPLEYCDGFLRVVDSKYYLVKRIPVDYLKNAVYPVYTDTIITYGSEYTFNAVATQHISCAALDSTHFVVAFWDNGGGRDGIAMIGVVSSGDEIAFGSEYEFNSGDTHYASCAALDATHFVISYKDTDHAGRGKAVIGVVSGTPQDDIAFGSEYEFNTTGTTYISCAALDSTHFVVVYRDDGGDDRGHAKIGVVSGTPQDDIAFGSEYEFNAGGTYYVSCAALDSTHFVVSYMDSGDSQNGNAVIGVVTGDAIAYGSEYTFNAAVTYNTSCAALDATHFVVGFEDNGDGNKGKAVIGVVSGTPQDDIAFGSEYEFNTTGTTYISCAALDSTHFVVVYRDDGGDDRGHAKIGVVSGTPQDDIAFGLEYTFNAAGTTYISCAALDSTHFVVGYRDDGGDDYGIARIGVDYTPEINISNIPNSKAWGTVNVNDTATTAINYFTITNNSGGAVSITIQGTDLTGGDDTWDLSDTATPGENIYGIKAGLDDADDEFDVIVKEDTPYNTLVAGLGDEATQDWGLKIYMPTSVTDYDKQQMSSTITLVATFD